MKNYYLKDDPGGELRKFFNDSGVVVTEDKHRAGKLKVRLSKAQAQFFRTEGKNVLPRKGRLLFPILDMGILISNLDLSFRLNFSRPAHPYANVMQVQPLTANVLNIGRGNHDAKDFYHGPLYRIGDYDTPDDIKIKSRHQLILIWEDENNLSSVMRKLKYGDELDLSVSGLVGMWVAAENMGELERDPEADKFIKTNCYACRGTQSTVAQLWKKRVSTIGF
ncbi:MAG: hypothetical protein KDH96_08205 [Candidatus Riesia sp.]|nr:hypothetical protein [Candidatus Riesia sp.]